MGDEAKGKFVDLLAEAADVVARFNGGDNAGHTVINPFGTFKLRLTPNGFVQPAHACVIGPGWCVNLETLLSEIEMIQNSWDRAARPPVGLAALQRGHALPPAAGSIYEQAKGAAKTGTTRRGMGPVFADKVSYNGIRLFDLARRSPVRRKAARAAGAQEPHLAGISGIQPLDFETRLSREACASTPRCRQCVREPFGLMQETLATRGRHPAGRRPGRSAGQQLGHLPLLHRLDHPGRWCLRRAGHRPALDQQRARRCQGLHHACRRRSDAHRAARRRSVRCCCVRPAPNMAQSPDGRAAAAGSTPKLVRFTCQLNGVTDLALTKLDVLDSAAGAQNLHRLPPPESGDRVRHYWEGDAHWLEACQPVYIERDLAGSSPPRRCAASPICPPNAQAYVRKIEELIGAPVR